MFDSPIDWVLDHIGWIVLALIAALVWLLVIAFQQEASDREHFMAECTKDRKEYECVAMWRAGEKHDSVVPVFIPVR